MSETAAGTEMPRALRILLYAYPRGFREQYGRDLADLYRDEYGSRGPVGFWLSVAFDALWNGTAARLSSVAQDVRYGARGLRQNPGFTIVVLLTLALGIGANTAIFSVIDGVLLRPLPYPGGDRIVHLRQNIAKSDLNAGFSPLEVADYRAQATTLRGVVEHHSMYFTLLGRGEPRRVQTGVVSWQFFDVLGVRPILGRGFSADDEKPGVAPVVLLGNEFWHRALGGDPSAVGSTFVMNDKVHTVIGVLPSLPQYPREQDVYMPTTACPFRGGEKWANNRQARGLTVFARLADGVTLDRANRDLSTISDRLHAEYPKDYASSDRITASATALREELTQNSRPTLFVLLATAGFLLLIVCANVANLTLARLARRGRELSVRIALGATRGRLFRQLLTEGLLLSLVGGAIGLGVAHLSLDLLVDFAARFTPRAREVTLDGRVLGFTLAVSLLTGVVLGALPALPARLDVMTWLKDVASPSGRSHLRLRAVLIVAQVAVSFTLLIGAGLMLRSFVKLQSLDTGFDTENSLTAQIPLNWSKYDDLTKVVGFENRLLDELRTNPAMSGAALTSSLPLKSDGNFNSDVQVEGRPTAPGEPGPRVDIHLASPDYFRTMGIPLLTGRVFTADDRQAPAQIGIISRSLAHSAFGSADPLGRRLLLDDGKTPITVTGVVADVTEHGLSDAQPGVLYLPLASIEWRSLSLVVRSLAPAAAVEKQIRAAVRDIDRDQPVTSIRTLAQLRSESLSAPRLTTVLLVLFAALALAVTAAGIAGVLAYAVSQRTQEIGIRLALGAAPGTVLQMVMRQGMALVGAGLVLGLGGALVLSRTMQSLLFGVGSSDPLTFAGVAAVLFAVAFLACFLPARRVMTIDPQVALRAT
ncbi:MAG: ABC transporter permease [Myxococcales bacterium]